jgi:DNA-directed RNA polymerase subunit D
MIKLTSKSSEKVSFKADIPISLLNAIRRSVNYIPVLAIDSLEISKNDSALYDEIIAHRLGLVPLKNEDLKLPTECDCGKEEGCGKCSMKLKMSVVGPLTVYSDQLNPKGVAVYKMPITILDKDQELEFVALARMGLGVQHAKFDPGVLYYKYSDDSKEIDDAQFNKLIEETKKQVNRELDVSIESWGQMPAKEIFTSAIDALNKELKSLVKQVK